MISMYFLVLVIFLVDQFTIFVLFAEDQVRREGEWAGRYDEPRCGEGGELGRCPGGLAHPRLRPGQVCRLQGYRAVPVACFFTVGNLHR